MRKNPVRKSRIRYDFLPSLMIRGGAGGGVDPRFGEPGTVSDKPYSDHGGMRT